MIVHLLGCTFFSCFFRWCFIDFPGFSDRNWTPKVSRLGLTPTGLPLNARCGVDIVPTFFFVFIDLGCFLSLFMIFGRFSNDFEGFVARYLVLFCNISHHFRDEHADTNTPTANAPTVTNRKTRWRNRGLPR